MKKLLFAIHKNKYEIVTLQNVVLPIGNVLHDATTHIEICVEKGERNVYEVVRIARGIKSHDGWNLFCMHHVKILFIYTFQINWVLICWRGGRNDTNVGIALSRLFAFLVR